jgi:hypothetical protein
MSEFKPMKKMAGGGAMGVLSDLATARMARKKTPPAKPMGGRPMPAPSRPPAMPASAPPMGGGTPRMKKGGMMHGGMHMMPDGKMMKNSDMKDGGKADMGQDKAMVKKAFKQHDAQEHKGGKGTNLKLKMGGKACYADGGQVMKSSEMSLEKMPQGKKAPSAPVKTNFSSGTFKNGGRAC